LKKVLIAVDGKKNSKEILSLFQNLIWAPENIILLHVEQLEGNSMMTAMLGEAEMSTLKESLKGTEHKAKLDQNADSILNYYKTELENSGLKNIRTVIREGHHSDEILKTAEEENVDLIVLNCSGKTRLQRLVTGCASREVEKNAKMPVLITKGDGCGEHAQNWAGRESYAIR
jgi:nucleotide-binding universal stress UspA family protein